MKFTHPLFGKPSLTASWLLERCDQEAAQLLNASMALARWRARTSRSAAELLSATAHPPRQSGANREVPAGLTERLLPIDVLRAAFATHQDLVRSVLSSTEVKETVAEDSAYWASVLKDAPRDGEEIALEAAWAKSWGMTFEIDGKFSLRVVDVLASLPERAWSSLRPYSKRWSEFEITAGEFDYAVRCSLDAQGMQPLVQVCRAYSDRHDGLAAMDEGLRRSPQGVILCGPSGSGKSQLIEAWVTSRIFDCPHESRRSQIRTDTIPISNDKRAMLGYCELPNGDGYYWTSDSSWLADETRLSKELETRNLSARRKTIFVECTSESWPQSMEATSRFGFTTITVPPIGEKDQIGIAMAANPFLESVGEEAITVASCLAFLSLLLRRDVFSQAAREFLSNSRLALREGSFWQILARSSEQSRCFPEPMLRWARTEWRSILRRMEAKPERVLRLEPEQSEAMERFMQNAGATKASCGVNESSPDPAV